MGKALTVVIVAVIAAVIGLFIYLPQLSNDPSSTNRVSSGTTETCRACHESIYQSYIKTGHFLTSQPAVRSTVLGSFDEGRNVVQSQIPALSFKAEARQEGLFQITTYAKEKTFTYTRPFDVIVGSGERAQSYLFWEGEKLFQLPTTYVTTKDDWIISPGYDTWVDDWERLPNKNLALFYQRPIGGRCLECHASAITPTTTPIGFTFRPETLEFGISCEKCHGPGADHIAFHQENPDQEEGAKIVNPADLSRSQQLSSCALCHAGQGVAVTPPLTFRPGDEIAAHRYYSKEEKKKLTVHGGQVPFLEESHCFLESETMTCSTCHNVHEDQTDQIELFSKKCLDCHQSSHADKPELATSTRCTDCHMPNQQATNLTMFHNQDLFFLSMANHRIGIFKEQ
jgi:hypothetical protein